SDFFSSMIQGPLCPAAREHPGVFWQRSGADARAVQQPPAWFNLHEMTRAEASHAGPKLVFLCVPTGLFLILRASPSLPSWALLCRPAGATYGSSHPGADCWTSPNVLQRITPSGVLEQITKSGVQRMVVQPFSRFRDFKAGRFARLCRDLESLERVLAFDLRHFLGGGFFGSLGALAGAAAKHVFHANVFAGSV